MTARSLATIALAVTLVVALAATPLPASGAATGLGDTAVSPTEVTTGEPTPLDLSVNATGVNTTDGTTGATVTVSAPDAVDLSGATVDSKSVTPNATGVDASVDAAANAVTVSWDDDAGADAETLAVSVRLTGVVVGRTGSHDLTATVDADADGTTDVQGPVGTVTATASGSDRSAAAGDSLFLGEEDVDLTGVAGVAPAGESQRFYGVGGEAEGSVATVPNTTAADVSLGNGFTPGTYNLSSSSGTDDVVVERPSVRSLDVYPGSSTGETEVDGSSVPASVGTLTVEPRFNFAPADDATLIVENEAGLEVTGELTANPRVTASGQTVTLDVADLSTGTYTIRVEGADELDHVNATTTVRIRSEARTVTLSRTTVARGEPTVATVSGEPGSVHYLRLSGDALRDGSRLTVPTARAVFGAAEGLSFIDVNAEANVLYAALTLDDDGFARVELETERLADGTHDVAVAPDVTADEEATVPVTVRDRDVTVSVNETAVVGETVTVTGTAPGADDVKLYAKAGTRYTPLYEDTDTDELAETRVDADGSWEVDLDTRAVVDLPDRYRLAAVSNPDSLGSTDRVSEDTLRDYDAVGITPFSTVDASFSATASRERIATEDDIEITGHATGPGDAARLYVVGPYGTVAAHEVDVAEDDRFAFDDAVFDTPGRYRIVIVRPGRDATFGFADGGDAAAIQTELAGTETPVEATAILRDAYGGAGVDDRRAELNVTASEPRVTVETATHRSDELVVTGTSNRENGTVVALDVQRGPDVVTVGDATVNASGRWRTSIDVSALEDGTYTVLAETGDTVDDRTVRLGAVTSTESTAEPTPTETAMPTATATATANADQPAASETPASATDRATRTETTGDGFGALAALVALAASLLVARRRR